MNVLSRVIFAASLAFTWALRAAEVPDKIVERADGTKIITKTPPAKYKVLKGRMKDARYLAKSRAEWAKLSAGKKPTIDKLLQGVRGVLPKGWKADYVAPLALFCIWREERTLAEPFGAGLPLTLDDVRENIQVTYFLRVQALVSPEQYAALTKKKAALTAQLDAEGGRLHAMGISSRYDEFSPETKEQREAVAKYEALKMQNFDLPDFSFEDVSLKWDDIYFIKNLEPERHLLDLSHRAECAGVRQKIAALMKAYPPVKE